MYDPTETYSRIATGILAVNVRESWWRKNVDDRLISPSEWTALLKDYSLPSDLDRMEFIVEFLRALRKEPKSGETTNHMLRFSKQREDLQGAIWKLRRTGVTLAIVTEARWLSCRRTTL
jgi:hypothetical protein